jgi:hypothetical protein
MAWREDRNRDRESREKKISEALAVLQKDPTHPDDLDRRIKAIDDLGDCGSDAQGAVPVLVSIRDREDWPAATREAYVEKFVDLAVKHERQNEVTTPYELGVIRHGEAYRQTAEYRRQFEEYQKQLGKDRRRNTEIAHASMTSQISKEREHAAAALSKIRFGER